MHQSSQPWTHPSIRLLAPTGDPVEVVTKKAQQLAASMMDRGWTGPPFDPLELADLLRLEAIANDDVQDARTVPAGAGRVRIEFNPNRPPARIRYSIAHEIAHTLFPDCSERIRHRGHHPGSESDEWQLEALCNIAAAELLMPIEHIEKEGDDGATLERALELRSQFQVSTEAILIRMARMTDRPRAMFCASRRELGPAAGRYRLDYLIGSSGWTIPKRHEITIPVSTLLQECTAIGHMARGTEQWSRSGPRLRIEAIGIPPYPGARYPRVVGLVHPTRHSMASTQPEIGYMEGNAAEPVGSGRRLVVHIVNDRTPNWGGGGFAQAVRARWPVVQEDFKEWVASTSGALRLGNVRIVNVSDRLSFASIIAQHGYGDSATPRIRYAALEDGLATVAAVATRLEASIHMPRIGTGAAGGNWNLIEGLIRRHLHEAGLHVTVYDLPNQPRPPEGSLLLPLTS